MDFGDHLRGQDLAEHTVRGYVADMDLFAKWFNERNDESLAPAALTPTDIKEYRAQLVSQGLSAATVNRRLAALRAWGAWAVAARAIEANPAAAIHGLQQQACSPKWLDRKQQARLVREAERRLALARTPGARAKARRDLAMLVLLMQTGIRVSELCALKVSDVTLGERSGKATILGKGSKVRAVPLNLAAREALRAWRQEAPPSTYLFPGRNGLSLSTRNVLETLAKYGRRAEVRVSPHIMRHTFAKNLVDAGVPLEQVAALLGHAKLETTRRYTLPGERDLQLAVERLEL